MNDAFRGHRVKLHKRSLLVFSGHKVKFRFLLLTKDLCLRPLIQVFLKLKVKYSCLLCCLVINLLDKKSVSGTSKIKIINFLNEKRMEERLSTKDKALGVI